MFRMNVTNKTIVKSADIRNFFNLSKSFRLLFCNSPTFSFSPRLGIVREMNRALRNRLELWLTRRLRKLAVDGHGLKKKQGIVRKALGKLKDRSKARISVNAGF